MKHKFFNFKTKQRGFGRELYYTPIDIIYKIVDNLLFNYPQLKTLKWIDPCAADGRWADVVQKFGIECLSFDLVPLRQDVAQKDFLNDDYIQFKNYFFIGNPPYKLLEKFVQKALSLSNYCYFLGGGNKICKKLSNNLILLHRFEGYEGNQKDLRSKCKFIDTMNKEILTWTCGGLFCNYNANPLIIDNIKNNNNFAIGIGNFCKFDERIKVIKKNE